MALDRYQETVDWLDRHEVPGETPPDGWGSWILALADEELSDFEPTDYFRWLLHEVDSVMDRQFELERYISQIEPMGTDLVQSISKGVRIMTMAKSKGLTVRAAIITGVEDGVVPHPRAPLSEERRLLYVAMTRPRNFLYLTWARQRFDASAYVGKRNIRRRRNSPFLDSGPVTSEDGDLYLQGRFS